MEYLVIGAPAAVDRAAREVGSVGGRILRREDLRSLGLSTLAIDLEERMTSDAMRRRLASRGIAVALDRNSIFASAGGRAYAPAMIGAAATGSCKLARDVRIGLVDGPVDTAQAGLASVRVVSRSVLDASDQPAAPDHATALVSLIATPEGAADISGMAVGAGIYSAVAFARDGDESGMRLDHFARALDWLVGEDVDIVNMSIAGPKNRVLAALLSQADRLGTVLVAATGNDGRSEVAYPAADPHVIAITAVDARSKPYRAANSGPEVDFAAPGVDLLVVGAGGSGYRSGTSYAAAIASAVVAHEIGSGNRSRDAIVSALRTRALDLGPPGRDNRFGWGLLRLSGC